MIDYSLEENQIWEWRPIDGDIQDYQDLTSRWLIVSIHKVEDEVLLKRLAPQIKGAKELVAYPLNLMMGKGASANWYRIGTFNCPRCEQDNAISASDYICGSCRTELDMSRLSCHI